MSRAIAQWGLPPFPLPVTSFWRLFSPENHPYNVFTTFIPTKFSLQMPSAVKRLYNNLTIWQNRQVRSKQSPLQRINNWPCHSLCSRLYESNDYNLKYHFIMVIITVISFQKSFTVWGNLCVWCLRTMSSEHTYSPANGHPHCVSDI